MDLSALFAESFNSDNSEMYSRLEKDFQEDLLYNMYNMDIKIPTNSPILE